MNIDTITKELYEYIVSNPYGTEVATSNCLCELYGLEGKYIDQHIGWVLTNGELQLSHNELFEINAKLNELIRNSGKYFFDSIYFGAVGLPFNVGHILRTYDGIIEEFHRRKTRDYGGYFVKGPVKGGWHHNRFLVRIPPKSQMRYQDFGKLYYFNYLIAHGTGLCLNEVVTVGDSDSYGSQWRDLPEEWFIQNTSEEDMYIYFITKY